MTTSTQMLGVFSKSANDYAKSIADNSEKERVYAMGLWAASMEHSGKTIDDRAPWNYEVRPYTAGFGKPPAVVAKDLKTFQAQLSKLFSDDALSARFKDVMSTAVQSLVNGYATAAKGLRDEAIFALNAGRKDLAIMYFKMSFNAADDGVARLQGRWASVVDPQVSQTFRDLQDVKIANIGSLQPLGVPQATNGRYPGV